MQRGTVEGDAQARAAARAVAVAASARRVVSRVCARYVCDMSSSAPSPPGPSEPVTAIVARGHVLDGTIDAAGITDPTWRRAAVQEYLRVLATRDVPVPPPPARRRRIFLAALVMTMLGGAAAGTMPGAIASLVGGIVMVAFVVIPDWRDRQPLEAMLPSFVQNELDRARADPGARWLLLTPAEQQAHLEHVLAGLVTPTPGADAATVAARTSHEVDRAVPLVAAARPPGAP